MVKTSILKVASGVLMVCCLLVGAENPQSENPNEPQSGSTAAVSSVTGVAKYLENRAPQTVENKANKLAVRVEKIANPPPHVPGRKIKISNISGLGRLVGNYTVEFGRAAKKVGIALKDLGVSTAAATSKTVRGAARRIYHGREQPRDSAPGPVSGTQTPAAASKSTSNELKRDTST